MRVRNLVAAATVATATLVLAAGCGSSSNSGGGSTAGDTTAGGGGGGGDQVATTNLQECPVKALDSTTGKTEIVVWYALSAKTEQTLKDQVEKFNGSQDKVTVRVESQGTAYEELLRKYEAAIPSKQLPDVIMAEETNLQFLVDSGTVLPAGQCFKADGLSTDDFLPAAVKYYTVNGSLQPASASLSTILTYYNKNHFRRAGLDPEKSPATLDEVEAYARKIKAAGVVDKPIILKLDSWFVETQLTGAKAGLVDNDNGRGSGQTTAAEFQKAPETKAIFEWIKKMKDEGLLEAIEATDGQVNHYLAMAQQKASITVETSTAATSVKAFLGGDTSVASGLGSDATNVDLSKLDFGAGKVFGVTAAGKAQIGGNAFYIMGTTPPEHQAAAWKFMKWWNEPAQQAVWHLSGSYLPFNTKTVDEPSIKAFWTTDQAGKWLALAWDQLSTSVDPNYPGPLIGPFDQMRKSMRSAMDSLVFTGTAPDAAIATAADETTAAIQKYNGG